MLIWANSSKQKIENFSTKNDEKVCFPSVIFQFFCLEEMTQINIIYLSLTPGVPDGEKFVDKAFKSIKYSHIQKVVILAIFIQSFNILLKV